MSIKENADLFISSTDKIDFYWNFYTLTLLALIGWLVSSEKPLSRQLKLLISIGYLTFVAMNLLGLWGSYTFAEAVRQDLLAAAQSQPELMPHARAVLAQHSYSLQRSMAFFVHGGLAVVVLASIWFGRLGSCRSE